MVRDSTDEIKFPQIQLLPYTQVLRLHKAFGNNSSANIKLRKTHFYKIRPSG